jgi:UDP-N-acetylglucosamine 3-dehydrogenase
VHDRLRIGIAGAGAVIERYHIPAINAVPEVIRSIVVDANAERARLVADRYGFPKWSDNLQDLAEYSDLVIVGVPNWQHAPIACELVSKGIHVLCEKPMARNPDECLSMIESARHGNAQLCVGHNRRFRQHIKLAKKLLRKGIIGDVVNVEAEEGSPNDWPRSTSYFDPVQSGGGALMDVGIHSIDLIRWLAGEFENVEFEGNGTRTTVESEAELCFRLASGATGRVAVSRTRALRQRLLLTGSEGFLEMGLWDPTLRIRSNTGKAFENFESLDIAVSRRPPLDTSFVEQLRNLVSAVRGNEELLVNGYEGMAAVEVVYRAYTGGVSASPCRVSSSSGGG